MWGSLAGEAAVDDGDEDAMTTLKVSFDLLDRLSSRLGDLEGRMGDQDLDYYEASIVGHQRVADALHDFTKDWDDKREVLKGKLLNLGKLAGQSAEEFRKADRELGSKAGEMLTEKS